MSDGTIGGPINRRLRDYFLRGIVFIVPLVVTVAIIVLIVQFLSGFIQPVASFIESVSSLSSPWSEGIVLLILVISVVVIGFIIEVVPHGVAAADVFHSAIESIPGVGSFYGGFREMSMTVANGEESFRDVKLVEYPNEGSYTMAFVTADAPPNLEESTGHEDEGMVSLFLPMGPNPVMGGFVIYVSRNRVYDIDISVEEGVQAIVTSGVAITDHESADVGDRIRKQLKDA